MSDTHNCRICGGIRPCVDSRCMGCGSSLRLCGSVAAKKPVHCPQCGKSKYVNMEIDRFRCEGCATIFEKDDFRFLDDRPDVNAEKKERMMKREGGRR